MSEIVLVDKNDQPIGIDEKIKVHREGRLHRAFSVLIFNSQGEMLLQKRAAVKYHSGGLWTNACCSHPRPGKNIKEEAKKRLFEEMGVVAELEEIFSFIYRAELENDLVEYEFDHVFRGEFSGEPKVNPEEAEAWRWVEMEALRNEIRTEPWKFTPWFGLIMEKFLVN